MFVDEAKVYVKAGNGGNGCTSFYHERRSRYGKPDGGEGGDGGDAIFRADNNIHTLLDFQYNQHFKAESGTHGSSNKKAGHRGKDLIIRVPPGTTIKDALTGLVLRDLVKDGDSVIVAKGGKGGRGNSRHRPSEYGFPGEEKVILLSLKIIADVGIIGYPNAGKSTLISRVSSARPKIANYPFTTKGPVLGVVKVHDEASFVVCEIPGLIEGAHEGRGLGDRFLKHAERTKLFIHLIDIAAIEGRSPDDDYTTLNAELKAYDKKLAAKSQVVALNKVDLPEAKENIQRFKKAHPRLKTFLVSSATAKGLKELMKAVYKKLESIRRDEKI